MKVGKKELTRKNLLIPWFIVETIKFLFNYKALRFFDKVKIIARLLLRWILTSYIPVFAWVLLGMVRTFTGWGALANLIRPVFCLYILALPIFRPMESDNYIGWGLCALFDVFWLMVSYVSLNLLFLKGIKFTRVDALWRRGCLHCGLWTCENLLDESGEQMDKKEIPKALSVMPGRLIIDSKNLTPQIISEKRAELSGSMGLFIGDIQYLKKADGSQHANLIEVQYSFNDLPGKIDFNQVPVLGPGQIILGVSWSGWQIMDFEQMVHALICGQSGSGKSVFLRSLLVQTLATDRNAIVLCYDFKGGSEMSFLGENSNCVTISEIGQAAAALELILMEYKKRVQIVKSNLCDSVFELRRKTGMFIPQILIVVDEAMEFFSSKSSEKAVALIDKIARLGRFAGISLIISTQRPDTEAIKQGIRSQLQTRLVFQQSQKEDSIMAISSAAAVKLRRVAGRFLYRGPSGNLQEIQGPYLSKAEAQEILAGLEKPGYSELMEGLKAVERQQESYEIVETGRWIGGGQEAKVENWAVQEIA